MNKRYDYEIDYIIIPEVFYSLDIHQSMINFINMNFGLRARVIDNSCICLNLKNELINKLSLFFETRIMEDKGNHQVLLRKMDECEAPFIESKTNVLTKLVIKAAVATLQPLGIIDHGWYKIRTPHISL